MILTERRVRRAHGFSLVELLIVVAIVSVLGAISASLYVNWRATSLNRESVAQIEQRISDARQDSKRLASNVTLVVTDGATQLTIGGNPVGLPTSTVTTTASGNPVTITFQSVLGVQAPFEVAQFDVTTGNGLLERTSTVAVIPPLGKTTVVQ